LSAAAEARRKPVDELVATRRDIIALNMASRCVLTPLCVAIIAILIAAVAGKSEWICSFMSHPVAWRGFSIGGCTSSVKRLTYYDIVTQTYSIRRFIFVFTRKKSLSDLDVTKAERRTLYETVTPM